MSIWSHTLVRNEAKWLWFSVGSVVDFVDKVLLWDTGSNDGTKRVIDELINKFPDKIDYKEYGEVSSETFTKARQEMLQATNSDWFIVNDADEIWWDGSIKKVVDTIRKKGNEIESIVVPTVNLVGDIFHYQEEAGGGYKIAGKRGHFNLRAVKRNIPGLKAFGPHGKMGWIDDEGKMIQDRDSKKIAFIGTPYLHATYLPRAGGNKDAEVIKRKKKLKYEIGVEFPLDYYYPEVLFKPRPEFIESPWRVMNSIFKSRAYIETPLRRIKRRIFTTGVGY